MRSTLLRWVVLTLALSALAEPNLSPYQLHEKRAHIPAGWSHDRRHSSDALLPMRFALSQNNIDKIGTYLMEVSHPASPSYGTHWSAGDILRNFSPSDETVTTVRVWLEENGFEASRIKVTPNRGWIEVHATVEEAERLLQTEYHVYGHETGQEHVACDAYHLPEHVKPHIDFVTPTVHFDSKIVKRSAGAGEFGTIRSIGQPGSGSTPKSTGQITPAFKGLENCDEQITPICLRALYGLVYAPLAAENNSYGIVEYTPQAYLQSDLDMFASNFSKDLVGVSPEVVSIDGGYAQTIYSSFKYNGESALDLQYAMNLVTSKQKVTLYQVGDMDQGASFNNFLDAIDGTYCSFEGGDDSHYDPIYPNNDTNGYTGPKACGTIKPANVISTSYSYDEAELSPFYAARQCAEYAKLGLMGVTVLYSSGDHGVAGNGGRCLNANGTKSTTGTIFNPSFPSTCPYITSVGATQVNPGSSVSDPEGACEQVIHSGGGFSNYFAMPAYQKDAVADYLKNYRPQYPSSIWNSTGTSRGFPDISANGANYVVAVDGSFQSIFGTSCSSPVCGAIFTMINDARLTIGKKPIGFINPTVRTVFLLSGAFHDITMGGNQGCGTAGYTAVPGWDPVTGLGTPELP
ncbi:peptidase S8/S53 domain-containing protein [Melanogaster broomeanus]|nr:peptidase S8/S53 domain-containing protein [Melanogaster broomeanus]